MIDPLSPPDIKTRIGGPADRDTLLALERSLFAEAVWPNDSLSALLRDENPGSIIFASAHHNNNIGYLAWRNAGPEAEILSLGIAKSWQRKGVGRQLITAFHRHASESGCDMAFLEVADGNIAALALYRDAGYHQSGRRKAYYRDGSDALIMQYRLTPRA